MATERPRPALLQELLVARDDRHSYMQRMHSLAGPGAYKIPSTFQHPAPNLLLRVVQRENYGREFARQKRITTATSADTAESTPDASCQLCFVTAADTHRARRDQLRKMLQQADRWCQYDNAASPSPSKCGRRSVTDSRASSPRATSPDTRMRRSPSPSSRTSSPERQRWASADLADIVADFGEPTAAMEENLPSENGAHVQQQVCTFSAPLTYQHFLVRTSYLERLKKHQQQRAASQ
ncbi:hypothetical protein PI124_g20040 [Phytophthora idaei]|nr:hypothetical protein PI125_g21241 [Phytophthora idaei]KAG3132772.1 hypothetical protein PI126_g19495 [Phytophthora idaei]KAG3234913.1 hypothetical protein PI124_g20040 [Phytophthora idaei]